MLGSTRSGGLWLSRKALMLMITDVAGFDQLGHGLFVDHLATRGVDDIGVLADQL
jgi:hypothetical protein